MSRRLGSKVFPSPTINRYLMVADFTLFHSFCAKRDKSGKHVYDPIIAKDNVIKKFTG